MEKENDLWIFLSHSNKDYDLVKLVRNRLEEFGRRPIMFFLKCLDDNAEVWELIKREIDARPRFILCKSDNTEDIDGWVQKEFNYIKQQNKPYEIVDLNSPESLNSSIKRLVKRSKVYILSSSDNYMLRNLLKKELKKSSFDVCDWDELDENYFQLPGGSIDWDILYFQMIKIYAEEGYVICLWSKPLSNFQKKEFEIAILNRGKDGFVIPFATHREALSDGLFYKDCHDSYGIRVMHVHEGTIEDRASTIITELKRLDNYKNSY